MPRNNYKGPTLEEQVAKMTREELLEEVRACSKGTQKWWLAKDRLVREFPDVARTLPDCVDDERLIGRTPALADHD